MAVAHALDNAPLTVLVKPAAARAQYGRLFGALETLFPVAFHTATTRPGPTVSAAGVIELARERGNAPLTRIPRLRFIQHHATPEQRVMLADTPGVDRRLRHVELAAQEISEPLSPAPGSEPLATAAAGIVWARKLWPGPVADHAMAAPLTELREGESLRDRLYGTRGLTLIALVQFIRELTAPIDFRPPPLRATIVFDDPNLRRRDYGYIDYGQLVSHADAHGYHAVMAMIPRDARGADPVARELFRDRPDRLSLAFHGNDHVKRELSTNNPAKALKLTAQALTRVRGFEHRTGLRVDRVMTPPHGLCSEPVVEAMAALGFEALCAIHPQPWSARPPRDQLLSGWGPATFAGPLAVIARFPLTFSAADLALRAFMDSPLVFYGHHEDLAGGHDLLADAAARVNRLGAVAWMSLGAIARSNYGIRTTGGITTVRPYAGRVTVPLAVEHSAASLRVDEPPFPAAGLAGWSADGDGSFGFNTTIRCGEPYVDIRLRHPVELDFQAVKRPLPHPWAAARRAATELRDRAARPRTARPGAGQPPLGHAMEGSRSA